MTNEEILNYLKGQGFLPQIAQEPSSHLTATEETAASLPKINTKPSAFQPQTLNNPASALASLASGTGGKIPVAPVKPWQPPAEKAGAVPQQDELLALSKTEPSLRFTNTQSNFQATGLAVRQWCEATDKIAGKVAEATEQLSNMLGEHEKAIQKAQRESGKWPSGFEREGDGARCPDCRRYFFGTVSAWRHVQKVCPERARIARALAAYRPCGNALP
ncbi:MAG TPA: hypothetical protein VKV79_03170 [Terriglobia bacterium]|nr:hypothetical protein [Terriglobia bacterium]